MPEVAISLSDRGWVLERFAHELMQRLPYVALDLDGRSDAKLRYYLNYHAWRGRRSATEVAFFTHLERAEADQKRFFDVAAAVDHCICHSRPSHDALHERGFPTTVIPPGVDLGRFRPRLRIGVVGRTYHTGRKGEHIIKQVMDVPEVDWVFTGSGWPLPAEEVPDEDLPAFYRSLDYVLVPSLYEAGPMCVPEALACGVPVIAPAVGWVPEFPHIEYAVGDAADLRRVLMELLAERQRLRSPVLKLTWDSFAERHDALFRSLLGHRPTAVRLPATQNPLPIRPLGVTLRLHGSEAQSGGGPSVRVPRLAQELNSVGIRARFSGALAAPPVSDDIVHVFNVWSPATAIDALRDARRAARRVVFSPILLDLSHQRIWRDMLCKLLLQADGIAGVAEAFDHVRFELGRATPESAAEPAAGFNADVREMARLADALVTLSDAERRRLEALGVQHPHVRVIRNPVEMPLPADGDIFARTYGVRDYVLCVGRIEPRKNQLALMHALRRSDVPVVLLGHMSDPLYGQLVRRFQWPGLTVVDRLTHGSEMWRSAFYGARVFALPSWAEGGPLAAIEAAAVGLPLVVADHEDEREYFNGIATFVSPADPDGIRSAVLDAHATAPSQAAREKRCHEVKERFGWGSHVQRMSDLYREISEPTPTVRRPRTGVADAAYSSSPRLAPLVFDVTTLTNHAGRWTGISRLEAKLVAALGEELGRDLVLVAWNDRARHFVPVANRLVTPDLVRAGFRQSIAAGRRTGPLPEGARLVVVGSAWMQNPRYVSGLASLVAEHGLRLTPVISDLIPLRAPFWYPLGYAPVFRQNLAHLLGSASSVVAVSQATAADIVASAPELGLVGLPPVGVLRMGDTIEDGADEPDQDILELLADRRFVLAVGAIHARKNYDLLYKVWLRLVERLGADCPVLVIVGGCAWNGGDTEAAFRGDRRLAGYVQILSEVTDATLRRLYATAHLTVYPSLDEGWGLPVAESLRLGTPCIAAAAPSVLEIAPGILETLPADDTQAWISRIEFYTRSSAARAAYAARISSGYRPTDWLAAAKSLLSQIRELAGTERADGAPYDMCPMGRPIDLAAEVTPGVRFLDGWTAAGPDGRTISSSGARLALSVDPSVSGDVVLVADLAEDATWDGPLEVRDGPHKLCTWLPWRGLPLRHAVVPLQADGPRSLVLTFTPGGSAAVGAGGRGPAIRRLGVLRLCEVSVLEDALGESASAPAIEPGRWYNLRSRVAARALLVHDGVEDAEWGLACGDAPARIMLPLGAARAQPLTLELGARAAATRNQPVLFTVYAGGLEVATAVASGQAPIHFRVDLSAEARRVTDPIVLEVHAASLAAEDHGSTGLTAGVLGVRVLGHRSVAGACVELTPAAGACHADLAVADALLGPGWHRDGDTLVLVAARAELTLALHPRRAPGLRVTADVQAFSEAPVPCGPNLSVLIGGLCVGSCVVPLTRTDTFDFFVPSSLADEWGVAVLEFRVQNDFVLPGSDATYVRVSLSGIKAREEDGITLLLEGGSTAQSDRLSQNRPGASSAQEQPGDERFVSIDFRRAHRRLRAASIGLHGPEGEGSWTAADYARVAFPLPEEQCGRVRVSALSRVFGTAHSAPAQVQVRFGGSLLATWIYADDAWRWQDVQIDLSPEREKHDWLYLEFIRPDPVIPSLAEGTADVRSLGVFLQEVRIFPSNGSPT